MVRLPRIYESVPGFFHPYPAGFGQVPSCFAGVCSISCITRLFVNTAKKFTYLMIQQTKTARQERFILWNIHSCNTH